MGLLVMQQRELPGIVAPVTRPDLLLMDIMHSCLLKG